MLSMSQSIIMFQYTSSVMIKNLKVYEITLIVFNILLTNHCFYPLLKFQKQKRKVKDSVVII